MQSQAPKQRQAEKLPARGRYFITAVIVGGVAVEAHALHWLVTTPVTPLTIILIGLTAVSGFAMMRRPSIPISFSISDVFCITAALLVGPAAGAIAAGMDGIIITIRMSRVKRTPERLLFNMAAPALGTWLAAQLFLWMSAGQPVTPGLAGELRLLWLMTVFGIVNFVVNSFPVAMVVAIHRGADVFKVWRDHCFELWLTYFGGVFAAMMMMVLGHLGHMEALVLIVPLALLMWAVLRHAVGRAADQLESLGKMNKVYGAAIEAFARAVDTKDEVTSNHTRRVQENCVRLARRLQVTDDMEIQAIKAAALLHDVGKIGVPEHILNKPGRLTPAEFEIMKRHAPLGAEILSHIGFPYPVVPIVRHHHENWDGTGYPDRIGGDAIPIGARILSVVDCFDALTSDRPYRPRMEDSEALAILQQRSGNMYDPRVVNAFFGMYADQMMLQETPASAPAPLPAPTAAAATTAVVATAAMSQSDVLETFYRLGAEVAATMRAQELGRIVWRHLERHMPACSFVLFAYDPDSNVLVPQFRSDGRVVGADAQVPVGERLSGWVAATGRAIVNSDARLDQDETQRDTAPLGSALAVPVQGDGRVIAVLSFYAPHADAFAPAHRDLAEAAARVVTVVPLEAADLAVTAA